MNAQAIKRMFFSAVFFVIVWNVLDVAYSILIRRGFYAFDLVDDLVMPAVISIAIDLIGGILFKK